jgi:hypothetical protein
MNKEEILNQVNFDLEKAKAIHEWLTADTDQKPINLPPIGVTAPVSIHHGEDGKPDGIRVCALDEDFIIALHDEFYGEDVDFEKASTVSLFTDKQVYLYYYYLDDIKRLMEEAGGEPLDDAWYWTKTPSASGVPPQLFFRGAYGYLNYYARIYTGRVRVSLALNTKNP